MQFVIILLCVVKLLFYFSLKQSAIQVESTYMYSFSETLHEFTLHCRLHLQMKRSTRMQVCNFVTDIFLVHQEVLEIVL